MKSNMKNMLRLGTLALSAALLVSACGQKPAAKPAEKSASTAAATTAAPTSNFPEKPVTLMVMGAPGGSTDLLARAVEKVWPKYSKAELLVTNKAGAGGVEGANYVAKAKPDGYTLLMGYGSGNDIVMPHLDGANMPYKPLVDLQAVSRLSVHSVVVAVPANSSFKTVKEVVDWSKKENKPITAAVSTTAGAVDIVMRGIGKIAGVTVTPVPHQGGSQAVTTLVGGNTVIGGGHPSEIMPQVKSGKLRAIGVALDKRDAALKDVPTLIEQGINFNTWGSVKGIAAPKGTPKEVVAALDGIFKKISEDPEYAKQMETLMQPIMYQGPDDFAKFMKQASDEYAKMVTDMGLGPKK
ncbi:MAG: hypothetical protein K0R31_1834 [Clostridiales bacterium]|jgi:tripartite-type tricarboxylate transporter receptor subunit TctC|nr:hypothetical protein [Clostridiales bacterium]